MRPSRVFRLIVSIFVYLLSISMSHTSFLAGYSAILILTNPENIQVPDGKIEANFDLTDKDNLEINVPYKITNDGYFNLEDVSISITIKMTYRDIDDKKKKTVVMFQDDHDITLVKRDETHRGTFEASGDEFLLDSLPDYSDIDKSKPSLANYTADVGLVGKYGVRLYAFNVTVVDLRVGETSL